MYFDPTTKAQNIYVHWRMHPAARPGQKKKEQSKGTAGPCARARRDRL